MVSLAIQRSNLCGQNVYLSFQSIWISYLESFIHQILMSLFSFFIVLSILEARNLRSGCQQGWCLLRPFSLACRWLSILSSRGLTSVCLYPNFFFIRIPIRLCWGPPYLQIQLHSEVLEVKISTYEWGGG